MIEFSISDGEYYMTFHPNHFGDPFYGFARLPSINQPHRTNELKNEWINKEKRIVQNIYLYLLCECVYVEESGKVDSQSCQHL